MHNEEGTFQLITIKSDETLISNIMWTLITMVSKEKHGKWSEAYLKDDLTRRIKEYKKDFKIDSCPDVAKLSLAFGTSLKLLVDDDIELKNLLLHLCDHLSDFANSFEPVEGPIRSECI